MRYIVTFVINEQEDPYAKDAIVDALDSLRAKGAFQEALLAELEASAVVSCTIEDVEIEVT